MKHLLPAIAAFIALPSSALLAGDGPAASPELSLEQATLLRCSAAFAIVASEQGRGVPSALAYPPLKDRGKEYFVRSAAQLMDDLQLTRDQVQSLLQSEVSRLQEQSGAAARPDVLVDSIMQPCLLSLEASGL